MRVNKIFAYKNTGNTNFKSYIDSYDYDYDYGTQYNNITIKDVGIFTMIVSAIMLATGSFFKHEEQIKAFLKKGQCKLNKLI